MFKLAVYGRHDDNQATPAAYDLTGESMAFVPGNNAKLALLRGTLSPAEMKQAAFAVRRRHGLVGPDAGGWFARAQ